MVFKLTLSGVKILCGSPGFASRNPKNAGYIHPQFFIDPPVAPIGRSSLWSREWTNGRWPYIVRISQHTSPHWLTTQVREQMSELRSQWQIWRLPMWKCCQLNWTGFYPLRLSDFYSNSQGKSVRHSSNWLQCKILARILQNGDIRMKAADVYSLTVSCKVGQHPLEWHLESYSLCSFGW